MSLLAAVAGSLGKAYDPAAGALFARMTPAISAAQKTCYNDAILALKAAGIWATLDCMGDFCAPHSQAALLNWTENDHNGTAIGAPTFTAKVGYTTVATTSYISIDYIPNVDKVNFAQNSATLACEITAGTNTANNNAYSMGVYDGTGFLQLRARDASGRVNVNLNSSAATPFTGTVPGSRLGMTSASRTGASALEGYRTGSSVGTGSTASGSIPGGAFPVFIGGYNDNGTLAGSVDNTFAAWAIGGQWTTQQHADFNTIMVAFRTAMALT